MNHPESFLTVDLLNHRYETRSGTIDVFSNLSFQLPSGVTALLGPSGCGKTTLLKIVAGLLQPASGEMNLWSESRPFDTIQNDVFYSPQDKVLFPWLTILQNVEIPLQVGDRKNDQTTERHQRATAAIDQVGLSEKLSARPSELSGGMKSRASIAQAIVTGAKAILFDEPFTGLDEESSDSLAIDFRSILQQSVDSAIIVTHSPRTAALVSDQILVFPSDSNEATRLVSWDETDCEPDSETHYTRQRKVREIIRGDNNQK